jgi:hypothetical protein
VTSWERLYDDRLRLVTGFLALGVSGFTCAVAAAAFTTQGSIIIKVADIGFGMVFSTFAWRYYRTALVTSRAGVRVRWVALTRTVPWDEVSGFSFGEDWPVADRLWIDLVDGGRMRTPVQRMDWFWYGESIFGGLDGGTWLEPDGAEALLHDLDVARSLGLRVAHREGRATSTAGPVNQAG